MKMFDDAESIQLCEESYATSLPNTCPKVVAYKKDVRLNLEDIVPNITTCII